MDCNIKKPSLFFTLFLSTEFLMSLKKKLEMFAVEDVMGFVCICAGMFIILTDSSSD